MPVGDSEALVLRTWPYRDSDLIVSFFTRDRGKMRGVARGVRKPKNKFGVSLERLAHSRVHYQYKKEDADLVNLQKAELAGAWNLWRASYPTAVALDLIAEVSERTLQEADPNERFFRLLRLTVGEFCEGISGEDPPHQMGPWATRALVYFLLWTARLGGWLAPLDRCAASGHKFGDGEPAYFETQRDGLFSPEFRTGKAIALSPASRSLAAAMLKATPGDLDLSMCRPSVTLPLQQYLIGLTLAQIEGNLGSLRALRTVLPKDVRAGASGAQ